MGHTGFIGQISSEGERSAPAAQGAAGPPQPAAQAPPARSARPFNLLRWFSIASLLALVPVAATTGAILSHFIAEQALHRDALLTAQFIQNSIHVQEAQIGARNLNPYLDPRVDPASDGLPPESVAGARSEIYEHLQSLADALQTNVYAPDRMIVWSSNKALVGTYARGDEELDEAFSTTMDVARHHRGSDPVRHSRPFQVPPSDFFVENYVPLKDGRGQVTAVVEVYKKPGDLMSAIRTGQALVWTTTLLGGVVVYLGLFSIIRHGSRLLREQQHQLVEAQSQLFAGELATALAHSLRNPLSSMRNCAELALDSTDVPVRKNAQDIITQVDFLSQWIRELLLYSRPLSGETEPVDLEDLLDGVLASFAPTFDRLGIRLAWDRDGCSGALVQGNAAVLRQALHSVISNAAEAMPAGGELRIEVHEASTPPGIDLVISDTGIGMSRQQLAAAFRPFHTTKAQGVGVGLPMVKRAIERFAGFVTLTSAENAGTQVRLHFRI